MNKTTNKPKQIEIRPYQVKHFKRILEILQSEYGFIDVSPMGAGKTHTTCGVAATYKLNMMIFCPKSAKSVWKNTTKNYGLNASIMTYQSLRGMKCCDLNHNLLTRRTLIVKGKEKIEYIATETFEKHVKSGLLLVFDEYHDLRNDNTQLDSAHALVKSLVRNVRMGYKSRIALLSGTPCVKKESVTSTFKMLGIILSDKLYQYNRSSKEYLRIGIQEAIDKCNSFDPDETFAITCRPLNQTTAKTICHDLYMRVLKRFVVTSMPKPPIDAELECRNFYILMSDENVNRMKNAMCKFKTATDYRNEIQEVNFSNTNWGDVTTSRMEIDSAKIPEVCRLVAEKLETVKQSKIVIYCTYKRDIKTAIKLLSKYNPLSMDGSTNDDKREEIINYFQENNNNYRVLVTNPQVGGISINLDDKHGNRLRFTYMLPSYFFINQHQAEKRIYRIGTKSKATIYYIYSRAFPYENSMLNSIAAKSEVLKDMIISDSDYKLPGEYDELLELTSAEKKEKNL